MSSVEGIGGIVFDCDGVLVDTTPCWDDAFTGAAATVGLSLGPGQLTEIHGASVGSGAARIAEWAHCEPETAVVAVEIARHLAASIDRSDLRLIPGIGEFLDELHGAVRIGVASNSPRAILLRLLARLEITEYFGVAIGAEDVRNPKPAPDPYLAACWALRIDPELSLAIEDSEIGVRSATSAGLAVIEVVESTTAARRPLAKGALRVASLSDERIRRFLLDSAVSHHASASVRLTGG